MIQESEMLKKRSFRQNIQSIVRIVKMIHSMDESFYAWNLVSVIMKSVITCGAVLLSSFIVDGLSIGRDYRDILKITIGAAVLLSLAASVDYFVDKYLDTKMYLMETEYESLKKEKLMSLDFALIDSPKLKEIRDRMQRERNWGAGIYSVFWLEKGFLTYTMTAIASLVLLVPHFSYCAGLMQPEMILIFVVLLIGILAGICMIRRLNDEMLYFMFHIPTKEERKWFMHYVWDFAMQDQFHYGNGKDVRIFDAYDLMKAYSYDRLQGKKFQDYVFKGFSLIQAGRGMTIDGMTMLIMAGSYLLAVILAKQGGMSAGNVILFGGCLSNFFVNSTRIAVEYQELVKAARQQEGVFELFDLSDEMYKGSLPLEKRSDGEYQIEFKHVSFRYPGSKEYALKDFSMKLKIGEKLAIVGRNGSGKTTMIKLLCRLYDPDEGEILLNGVDIRKFRHEEYVTLFSVIFQDYTLIDLLLSENVAASHEVDVDKVRKCLKDSGFGKRLLELPKGIETYLYKGYTDEGVEISGGEAQKIAIARALYKNAPFVLLDEPTAALDPVAESEIYTNFDKIVGKKTAIYISHRLSSCKFCDKIAVFKDGSLIQYGTHASLLAQEDGEYAKMWNKQAKYYVTA